MKYKQWPKCDPIKNYFQLPNEIFLLGLSPGALAVYSYLLCCENRNTYQCWPSYRTIGRAVRMSANTVRKYVCELEEHQLISTESTTVTTKAGLKRNGNLLYTIRPIQLALDQFYDQQLAQMSVAAERQRVAEALALHGNITPNEQQMTPGSELKRAVDRVTKCENQLMEQMEETEQETLTKLIRSQHEINSITATENFIPGFRLGVRLMAECMDENDGDIWTGGE